MDKDKLFAQVYSATIGGLNSQVGKLKDTVDPGYEEVVATHIRNLSARIAERAYIQAQAAVDEYEKHRQFTSFREWAGVEDFDPNPPDNHLEFDPMSEGR